MAAERRWRCPVPWLRPMTGWRAQPARCAPRQNAGFPESFAQYIGRPLTAVPDPCGRHQNWAEHFKEPLRESLARLGTRVTEISQTQMYTSGTYTGQII